MGDQQKVLRRRKKKETKEDAQEPSKEENEVGKYVRWNCPSKTSTMMGEKVEYFIGSNAVNCLLDSKWASGKGGAEILFTNRGSAETYLDRLLIKGFFNRDDDDSEERKQKKATEGNADGDGKKKRKVKVKLELHDDQFLFRWLMCGGLTQSIQRLFVMGVLVVIATIAICLFPLWPSNVREYVWYLSVTAAVAVGAILVLALCKFGRFFINILFV
ncbi:Translocation protein S62 [Desmophyllum pertusum]|uniref:Translocation protein SEC62 n=1 Tax=Desmophyllum pertusum TaxID=174260 RepID=A0A9W9ZGL4_9CNID|nr:Translocation protein S62 [Desmophyllum pertusum]